MEDDRFAPISLSEVHQLAVGLSLLTNFTDIDDPFDWEVGKHGIEIEITFKGKHYSATFLPEVAEEEGWDQATTLEYLLEKAEWPYENQKAIPMIKAKTYESLKYKLDYADYNK